jgi:two-component system, sensor histidine kinase YesM
MTLRIRGFLLLVLSFSLVIVLFVTLYYVESVRRFATSTRGSQRDKLQLVDRALRATIDRCALPGRSLAYSREFQRILSLMDTRGPSGHRASPLINDVESLSRLLESLPGGPDRVEMALYLYATSSEVIRGIAPDVHDLSAIDRSRFYAEIEKGREYTLIREPAAARGELDPGSLYLARQIYSLYEPDIRFAGVLMTRIPMEELRAILASGAPAAGSTVSVVDDRGWVQVSSRPSLEGTNQLAWFPGAHLAPGDTVFFRCRFDGVDSWVAAAPSLRHWYIAALMPMREAFAPLRNLAAILAVMLAGSLAVSALLSYGLSRWIADPIEKLVSSIRGAQRGDFSRGIDHAQNDEFSLLVSEYNRMLARIDSLVHEKTDAELAALQAQINPHFLYNALDTVNWMALEAGQGPISDIVTRLADFYRYTLSRGRKVISLADEIEQARSYLTIQAAQYPDAFDFSLECAPAYAGNEIVKLVIQPLVENAIVHGFQDIPWKGSIGVAVAGDERAVRVEVRDNGRGADAAELNAALGDPSRSAECFAIQNVNARVRDRYGPGYGLSYRANQDGRGVSAVITIPRRAVEAR